MFSLTAFHSHRLIHTIIPRSQREEEGELFVSTEEACHNSVEKLCKSGRTQEVSHLLRELRSRLIPLSLKAYNDLLAAAAEKDDCDLSLEIFKGLLLSSSPPDPSSYTHLAKSLQKAANPSQILRFAQEVLEITGDREPTVVNRIIFILAKMGQTRTALMIFEDMKSSSRKMDSVTFNTAIGIFGKQGQIDRMISEFISMKELGHAPDYITYNTLVNSLRRFGKLDLCSSFLKEMVDAGIEPDLQTYTAIIDSFGRAGHTDDAVRVLGEMKRSRAGKLEMADGLLEEMNSSKLLGPGEIEEGKRGRRRKRWSYRDWKPR
ncbi:unnamed protein product [Spirodela intermedia]|uniref:Uncharacterized protein n=1 Tax=Spirodela intermedia TaxID=51605 RepID=A0A7I8IUX1_SPIIN|nr:unnamed protein product [Spirodela intermedia]CAA6661795.1 unnamed protein product [Spirodela intermedia]